jgi:type VI secretion system protein ImpK
MGLLECFHEFHAEVVSLKRDIFRADPPPPEPDEVKRRLVTLFEKQSTDALHRLAEHEQPTFRDAQYVMVAMADEVFLHLDWNGLGDWTRRPLEAEEPFGSHVAGERIFQRIDEIVREREAVPVELLSVYLAALALDFQGKYRYSAAGSASAKEPANYRRKLAKQLEQADESSVRPATELCPAAYDATLTGTGRRGLPTLRVVLLVLLIIVLCWLFIGLSLWYYQTLEVTDQIGRIEDANEQLQKIDDDLKKAGAHKEPR